MLIEKLKWARNLALLVCIFGATGCASSVLVTGAIPAPMVPKVPLTAKLQFSDDFRRYNYEEKERGRGLKNLEFGAAQVLMFDKVFRHKLNLLDEAAAEQSFDLLIVPELLDFQYTAPRETKLNLYEVWLKYRVKITDSGDSEVADWVVKGYGKTPTAMLSSASKAFNAATNVALRDVGAQLLIGFERQDAIRQLLDRKAGGAAVANTETGQNEDAAETETASTEPEAEVN